MDPSDAPSQPPFLEYIDLSLSFPNAAKGAELVLDRLHLSIGRGEIVSLLGPSGCGKSTLLRVIAGLLSPSSGTILQNGKPLKASDKAFRESLSFVFQESALLPWRSVWQNTLLPLELRGLLRGETGAESLDWARHWLRVVGLQERDWNKKPNQLSGGMKMRASIARAMATRPQILLMDEPFAALDDVLRSKLNDLILRIAAEEKCTVLFVTHNIAEAVYISDKIAVMSHGRISDELSIHFPTERSGDLRSSVPFAEYYGQASSILFRNAVL